VAPLGTRRSPKDQLCAESGRSAELEPIDSASTARRRAPRRLSGYRHRAAAGCGLGRAGAVRDPAGRPGTRIDLWRSAVARRIDAVPSTARVRARRHSCGMMRETRPQGFTTPSGAARWGTARVGEYHRRDRRDETLPSIRRDFGASGCALVLSATDEAAGRVRTIRRAAAE